VNLPDNGGADGGKVRGGDQENTFQVVVNVPVGLGNGVFILKIRSVAQPAQQKLRPNLSGVLRSKSLKRGNADIWLAFEQARHHLKHPVHRDITLLAAVIAYGHHHLIKQVRATHHHIVMAIGKGVKRSGEKSDAFHVLVLDGG